MMLRRLPQRGAGEANSIANTIQAQMVWRNKRLLRTPVPFYDAEEKKEGAIVGAL